MIGRRAAIGLLTVAGTIGLGLAGAGASPAAHPQQLTVPVDRQDYVTSVQATNPTDGSIIDPYNNDPSTIHVAVSGGQETARSFVHLALDYLPKHAQASQATMTLHLTQQSDASSTGVFPAYNVNTSQAIVQACALTTELPANFDRSKPPAYDCQHGSAVARSNAAHDTFTFDLADLVRYWDQHGNTGAALIPVGSGNASQSWAVGFYKSRSQAEVSYTLPKASTSTTAPNTSKPSSVAGSTGHRSGGRSTAGASLSPGGSGAGGPPAGGGSSGAGTTTGSAGGAPPQVAGGPPATAPQPNQRAASSPTSSGGHTVWPWVLLGCLLVAGGALGLAHRTQLAGIAARVGPPGLAAFRAHPRAYSVASVAVAWSLAFTGYSLSANSTSPSSPRLANGTTPNGGGSVLPDPTGSTTPGDSSTGNSGAGSTGSSGAIGGGTATSGGGAGGPASGASAGGGGAGNNNASGAASVQSEFKGKGSYRTIDGVRVFFPAQGGAPVADLYHGADDTVGISPTQIELCAHAALTYGSAFHISAKDLTVYWQWLNAHGGIFGRQVHADFENDNYDPGTAVQAAQTCKDLNTFFLLGGIGFDQIPAVRQWAEQNHELYYHHIATIEGSAGLRYSFSPLPTVEQMGTAFGHLAVQRFRGQKIGVLYRQSSNWSPGSDAFIRVVRAAGMQVISKGVTINQGNYTQELTELHSAGVKVVFAWENALATTEMLKQAQGQNYHPSWLVFPFNLETNTLGRSSLDQPILGVAAWDAYDPGYYGGGFAPYVAEIHQFEAQYHQYDGSADLSGDGGDLLFLNWEGQKQIADLLQRCGPQCTRNRIAGLLLAGYDHTVPPNCNINFGRTSDHHHGGDLVNVFQVEKDPNGRPNFVPIRRCIPA